MADAIAALLGSMLGVSTVATFAESTAGVADGAKTGEPRGEGLVVLALSFDMVIMVEGDPLD